MYAFLRKSPLCRSHFFEWLKTAISSTACGRVTLKSPPSRGSDAPHVHPRLRKHLSRCTLDCGFKTSESPALRGFVAERCPITGTSLYLVLKSNGLRYSKNPPVRFSFSLKIVPATIAKKLPLQLRPKPLFIAFFSLSHKRPTFAFTGESVYTLAFAQRIAHKGTHAEAGAFSPLATVGFVLPAKSLLFHHAFVYIHFPVLCEPSLSATALSQTIFHPDFQLLAQTAYVCFHRRKWVHTRLSEKERTQRHTRRKRGRFGWGAIITLDTSYTFTNIPGPGIRTAYFAAFGAWSGAPKERRKPSEQRCAYARRCSEAPRPRWAA
jgi:hypothetical protein